MLQSGFKSLINHQYVAKCPKIKQSNYVGPLERYNPNLQHHTRTQKHQLPNILDD